MYKNECENLADEIWNLILDRTGRDRNLLFNPVLHNASIARSEIKEGTIVILIQVPSDSYPKTIIQTFSVTITVKEL